MAGQSDMERDLEMIRQEDELSIIWCGTSLTNSIEIQEMQDQGKARIKRICGFTVATYLGQCQTCCLEGYIRKGKKCRCSPALCMEVQMEEYLKTIPGEVDVIFLEVGVNEITNLYVQPFQRKYEDMSPYQKTMLAQIGIKIAMLAKNYSKKAGKVVILKTLPRRDSEIRQHLSKHLDDCVKRACDQVGEPKVCIDTLYLEDESVHPEVLNLQLFGKKYPEPRSYRQYGMKDQPDMVHMNGNIGKVRVEEEMKKLMKRTVSKEKYQKEDTVEVKGRLPWHLKALISPPKGYYQGQKKVKESRKEKMLGQEEGAEGVENEEYFEEEHIEMITID